MRVYAYRAVLEPGDDPAVTVVSFPDVPEANTEGVGPADTRSQARDALGLALLAYARAGRPLPRPDAVDGELIDVEPDVAAKLAVVEAFGESGLSKRDFARRLGKDEKEIRRILDPMHATRLTTLTAALAALGRRLVIGVAAAA
ncbi:MAG: type II toxin-antitoxin system HicB family antitoxin [Hyphomicrobiaceae bacterium]|nr:type II toxin-antitoxin system HicB family antitoxin [Hyphomicrobiaceae bacterium]